MRWTPIALVLWISIPAFCQDARLAALHETLQRLRSIPPTARTKPPSKLTAAKHQLRDWIESQLTSLTDYETLEPLLQRINATLKTVQIANSTNDQDLLGSLADVRMSMEAGMLLVTTGVGILCQYDESAYSYKRVGTSWQRVWESEQNDYTSGKYAPQHMIAVHVSQRFKHGRQEGPAYVLTLGHAWGCWSTWHPVYYRVWRVGPSGSKQLIDDSELAWLRAQTYAVGSIAQHGDEHNASIDVVIEFTQASIDGGVHNREAIRHFVINGDTVQRVDPVALSPRDFIDEWLTRDWKESAAWSASSSLQSWHTKLRHVSGEFSNPTMHCQSPDLWQVTFQPYNAQKKSNADPEIFFLVRWRPPYHFTMAAISDKPWPRCIQEDPEADEWRTLFPTQEWLW